MQLKTPLHSFSAIIKPPPLYIPRPLLVPF
nr:MAG TPA: hypothetical protein [Caudoviricetes sp.]